MGKKKTLEEIAKDGKKVGLTLLSKKEMGVHFNYKWRCKKNHIIFKESQRLKEKRKFHCRKCFEESRGFFDYTYENLKKLVQKKGGELLSKKDKEYKASVILKVKCDKGHIFNPYALATVAGRWCGDCFKIKKRTTIKNNKKRCARCEKFKPFSEFSKRKDKYLNLGTYCKICERLRQDEKEIRVQKKDPLVFIGRHFRSYKSSAKKRGIYFNLDKKFLIDLYKFQNGLCALSDEKMTFEIGKGRITKLPGNISLDRINSKRGYIKGNVRFVCTILNNLKWELDNEIFIKMIKKIYDYQNFKR